MSIPGSLTPLFSTGAGGAAGYQIERSLRFNSSDSGFCSRTPGTASNRKTWTWAAWVKRTVKNTATDQMLFTGGTTNSDTGFLALDFNSSDKLRLSSAVTNFLITTAVYRDPGAWMHIVLAFDATQGTNANKVKLYVNSTEVTVFDTDGRSSISNQDYGVNQAAAHEIGRASLGSNKYLDGYLADIHFIDGQALTPSSFTEVSATTGQLIPKAYAGTYTGNSFWLKFNDNSAATAATLGKDSFLLGNNWTPNNLSVTAGAGNDSLVDTPTSFGTDTYVGGEVRGNYATLNPLLASGGSGTLTNGNLDSSHSSGAWYSRVGTIYVSSGKYYWEHTITAGSANRYVFTGIANSAYNGSDFPGSDFNSYAWYGNEGNLRATAQAGWNVTYDNGDVIGVALDMDNGKLYFSKNGTFVNSSNPAAQTNPQVTGLAGYAWAPAISYFTGYGGTVNFGQRAFAYTAPSGFKALCDTNLPAPLVALPNTLMDAALWTGTGAARSITGLEFNPDWVWIKSRSSGTYNHRVFDTVRGATKELYTSLTNAESTSSTSLTSFNSNGFSLDSDPGVNEASATYVGWAWDAGTTTASNGSGSITSQVRANVSAGFSVVTYTGPGPSNNTVGHGLGVAPELIITKNRDRSIYWIVYTKATGKDAFLRLNTTDASTAGSNIWGTAAPTSAVFGGVGTDQSNGYTAGEKIVSYCFAPVVGYSSFGSYTGNGSTDGPFIFTSFRPRWLLVKNATNGGSWVLHDTTRSTYNVSGQELLPDLSGAEYTFTRFDFLSNGFKGRTTNNASNTSSDTYIFAAFAESPFSYSRAR